MPSCKVGRGNCGMKNYLPIGFPRLFEGLVDFSFGCRSEFYLNQQWMRMQNMKLPDVLLGSDRSAPQNENISFQLLGTRTRD